jgi:uncharacterized protein
MAKDLQTPLNESEIETLDAFLSTLAGPVRSLEGLDGLLCALNCAPTKIKRDDYVAALLVDDTFTDEKEADQVSKMIERHYHTVTNELQQAFKDESAYTPALMVDEDGQALGNEWSLGFLFGISMTEDDWVDFSSDEQLAQFMLPMMVLAHEHHPDPKMRPEEIPDEGREELLQMMSNSAAIIYNHFNGKPAPKS